MIICECGELIDGNTFKEYIQTSANPSTPTIGHTRCGLIFNFIDDKKPKKYSTKKELKSLAMKFARMNNLDKELHERFLLEINRLKTFGKFSDYDILLIAFQIVNEKRDTNSVTYKKIQT